MSSDPSSSISTPGLRDLYQNIESLADKDKDISKTITDINNKIKEMVNNSDYSPIKKNLQFFLNDINKSTEIKKDFTVPEGDVRRMKATIIGFDVLLGKASQKSKNASYASTPSFTPTISEPSSPRTSQSSPSPSSQSIQSSPKIVGSKVGSPTSPTLKQAAYDFVTIQENFHPNLEALLKDLLDQDKGSYAFSYSTMHEHDESRHIFSLYVKEENDLYEFVCSISDEGYDINSSNAKPEETEHFSTLEELVSSIGACEVPFNRK